MVFKKGGVPWNRGKKTGPRSEKTKRKLSIALSGKNNSMYGKVPWNKGIPRTDETKRKISIAKTGKKMGPRSEETKKRISIANRGKKRSEESRRRMSEAQKGRIPWNKDKKCPQLSRVQMGENNSFYGRKHSEETKRKMSTVKRGKNNSSYGKTLSEETKAKIRAARLKQVFPKNDTSIEIFMQKELDSRNIEYETHVPVCGVCQPDIVFRDVKLAVFADGNYWHAKEFDGGKRWDNDRRQDGVLRGAGWSVLRFWGSEIREDVSLCVDNIEALLG